GGLGQLLAAIAERHAPQARHTVEDAVAVRIGQPHAVGARHDAGTTGGELLVVGEGVQVMGGIQLLQLGGGWRRHWHSGDWRNLVLHTLSSRCSRSQELITCRNTSYSDSLTMVNALTNLSPSTRISGAHSRS